MYKIITVSAKVNEKSKKNSKFLFPQNPDFVVGGLAVLDKWMTYMSSNHRGCRVTIHKVWEQTFRAALYKMDTANLLLAMPGLFSGLAWLSCLLPLSDVGAASLDWAGNRV